jgi:CRISPR-associated protein Cas5t
MRVLKVKAYQLFANYRKPLSYSFIDTYPLPPLSTVKGWFHKVVGAEEYIPISIGIQGKVSSVVYDIQTLIKFDRIQRHKERGYPLLEGFGKTLSQSPTYVANVFDVELNIYLCAEYSWLEKFKTNLFMKEYPYLGRYEDLLRVDFIDFVNLSTVTFTGMRGKSHRVNYGLYLKKETAEAIKVNGINYRLNFKYRKLGHLRYFEKVDVVYVDNTNITEGSFLFDEHDKRIVELIGDYYG